MDRQLESCDYINEGSRLGFNSQSQMEMTQLTQTMDDLDDQPSQLSNLIEAEVPKVDPSKIPWARLIPHIQKDKIDISQEGISESVEGKYDLLPRGPDDMIGRSTRSRSITSPNMGTPSNDGITVLGCLKNIKSFDRFNEYTIGRNMKCDIVAQKTRVDSNDTEKLNMRNVIHSFVSNCHCRIFCFLSSNSVGPSVDGHGTEMEIYIEDTSGNGTILNNTTILKRNERRRLHTGDTICLLHPKLVKKKIKDFKAQQEFLDFYSFVFINLHETQRFKMTNGKMEIETPATASSKSRLTELFTNSAKSQNKRAAVNARATNSNSIQRYGQSNKEINDLSSVRKNIDKSHEAMQPPPAKKPKVARLISSTSTFKTRRIEEFYDLRDEIGSGTCGTVRRAINRKTGEMVAVKVIVIGNQGGLHRTFSKISKDGLLDPNVRAEISILQNLSHPYVVKLIDHFVHPGKAVYLVMELMQGGDLFDRIVQKGCYSELESRRIMRRMLAAVHYLHEDRDIVHRDLKPENILCVSRKNDIEVKLTDFGLAKSITEDGLKTFCGTPQYFAPEVLRRRNTVAGTGRYGKEADIWSIGVILYILLSGAPPFEATMDSSSSTMISFNGTGWRNITDDAKDLISKMLTKNPSQRINIKDACSHRWILIEDGDTHVHPLNDPVVLEATGGTQANNSCRNGQGQEGPQCPSPCDLIQNSNEIRNIISGGQSLPSSAARVDSNPRQNVVDAVHLAKEGESPNQSALFPTPKAKEESTVVHQDKTKRKPLFSMVKQLSTEKKEKNMEN